MGKQKLDDKLVEQMLRAGKTQMEVVDYYRAKGIEVTQSAISQAIKVGRIKIDTNRAGGGIPWKLKPEHRHLHAARMLRTLARLESGRPIGKTLESQVESWVRGLQEEDSVIAYDPDTEEGFWRVPRRPGIDLWYYRDPSVDDEGYARTRA